MKKSHLIFLFVFASILFAGCSSIDEAQLVADDFFEAYNTENEDLMESLLDNESVVDAGLLSDFYEVFSKHWQSFGKVTSYDRYAFETNSNNGITTVLLKFEVNTESGTNVFEKLRFIKKEAGYKIIEFEYNIDKSVI